jgi:hypothetical protein
MKNQQLEAEEIAEAAVLHVEIGLRNPGGGEKFVEARVEQSLQRFAC